MPFTKKVDREKVEAYRSGENIDTLDWAVGDWCYYYYKPMVDKWKRKPRWTTAHNIYKDMRGWLSAKILSSNARIAYELAWQVFFIKHIIPYENKKEKLNGEI